MLAMDVNDDVGCLNAHFAWTFFVGTPPGACSLLQGSGAFDQTPSTMMTSARATPPRCPFAS
jgi:hypothetical protein